MTGTATAYKHLVIPEEGKPRIERTWNKVRIIECINTGKPVDEIMNSFGMPLTRAEVHTALTYDHKDEINQEITRLTEFEEQLSAAGTFKYRIDPTCFGNITKTVARISRRRWTRRR